MARRQDYTVTPVTPPVSERKAFKSRDAMIQNCVNLELELQGRKLGVNGVTGGVIEAAKNVSPENNNMEEVHI